MNGHSSFDRDSFEKFLANAVAVQQSGLDAQSLSALVEIQGLIASGEAGLDEAMHLIADRALSLANASGVAIALLEAGQLVYRAGSGDAAGHVGLHVPAVLSVSEQSAARREILRVEDARNDPRIEAAICRQFGANSLLMLPIYRDHVVAGVFEVLFSEPHRFQDREVLTYRVMAGLVEEALRRDRMVAQNNNALAEPVVVPRSGQQATAQMQKLFEEEPSAPEQAQTAEFLADRRAAADVAEKLHVRSTKASSVAAQHGKRPILANLWRNEAAAILVAALLLAGWIAYDDRRPPPAINSTVTRSNDTAQQVQPVQPEFWPATANSGAATTFGTASEVATPRPEFIRVQVGPSEVDYIADDVTIRNFTTSHPHKRISQYGNEVDYGDDVTVRYFASNPGLPQTQNMSNAARSAQSSPPASK